MATRVVDLLEVVEVEEHDRERTAGAAGARERAVKSLQEHQAVREPSQRIMASLVDERLRRTPQDRHVPDRSRHLGPLLGLEESQRDLGGEAEAIAADAPEIEIGLQAVAAGARPPRGIDTVRRRHELRDRLAGELGGVEPEHQLGAHVAERNPAVHADHNDRVGRVLEQRAEPLLGELDRGHVLAGADNAARAGRRLQTEVWPRRSAPARPDGRSGAQFDGAALVLDEPHRLDKAAAIVRVVHPSHAAQPGAIEPRIRPKIM